MELTSSLSEAFDPALTASAPVQAAAFMRADSGSGVSSKKRIGFNYSREDVEANSALARVSFAFLTKR